MSEDGELYMYSYISRFAVLIHNDKVDNGMEDGGRRQRLTDYIRYIGGEKVCGCIIREAPRGYGL